MQVGTIVLTWLRILFVFRSSDREYQNTNHFFYFVR